MPDSAKYAFIQSARPPAVAGQFYPAQAEALEASVSQLLAEANVRPSPQTAFGGMVPHAGYAFSGACAATIYARLRGATPGRIVLLGRSHHCRFDGLSVPNAGHFETPLGKLPVDHGFTGNIADNFGAECPEAHDLEHALEVQLPFLQVLFGAVPIVPVLFGSDPEEWHAGVGEWLAGNLGSEDLLIASTDLSHFLTEVAAEEIDQRSLDVVLSHDYRSVIEGTQSEKISMCGATAVVVGMACAEACGANDWTLQDYRTSAKASGDTSRVVGYGAISFDYRR